jgi:hypothetical protein
MKKCIVGIVLSCLALGAVAHADCTQGQVTYQKFVQGGDKATRLVLRQAIFDVGALVDPEQVVKITLGFVGNDKTITRVFPLAQTSGSTWESRATLRHRIWLEDNYDGTATVHAKLRLPYRTFHGSYGAYATLVSPSCP